MVLLQVNVYFLDKPFVLDLKYPLIECALESFNAVIPSLYAIYVSVAIDDIDL